MIDEQLDRALKDDITVFDNSTYNLRKEFVENIKKHFTEYNDELKYIRFLFDSKMYSTDISYKHDMEIMTVNFDEYGIDVEALLKACSSNTFGLAVGDKICRLISFYDPSVK